MSKIFLLLGDSNVRRWIPNLGGHYRSIMEFVPAHNTLELSNALTKINSSYQTVIFAGLTNILVGAASEATTNSDRLEAISQSLNATLTSLRYLFKEFIIFCHISPAFRFLFIFTIVLVFEKQDKHVHLLFLLYLYYFLFIS